MIRLYTSSFPEAGAERRAEFAKCLERNLALGAIGEVCVIREGVAPLPQSRKLRVRGASQRPDYADFFAWMSEIAADGDISILANADIFFDESIGALEWWRPTHRTALALARWEWAENERPELNDRNDSQDAWVFRGPVNGVDAGFAVGAVRCDNRIARELELAGYEVLNPSFSIRSYHLHAGGTRDYDVAHRPGFVPPPYAYVWPQNLWSLPRTLAHNAAHANARVTWRVDRRRIRSTLKLHRVGKGVRMVLGAAGIGKERS